MRTLLLLLPGLLLVACSSPQGGDLGRLPDEVVELYHLGKPDGVLEIEADADGRIFEVEAEIDPDDLPPAVRAAAMAELPEGRITGAEQERIAGRTAYEVKLTADGRAHEFVFTLDGELLEKEVELDRAEAPAVVLQAAEEAVPRGTLRSVERIERLGEQEYHVKFALDMASYKVVLAPEGTVKRTVREAQAEIEIPLP